MAEPKLAGLAGLFDDPDALLRAAAKVRDAGFTRWDCHTPYPIHGLEAAMGLPRSPIAAVALAAGAAGVAVALGMQWWMNAVDYPINVGGKPLFSWPAFIPITFELFVLLTALATTALGLLLCRLLRWHSPLREAGILAEVTSTRFALAFDAADARFSPERCRRLLEETGCTDIRPLVESAEEERASP